MEIDKKFAKSEVKRLQESRNRLELEINKITLQIKAIQQMYDM